MRRMIVAGILLAATQAHAASPDCAKPVTPVDKVICNDRELSQLDGRLARTYEDALGLVVDRKPLIASQHAWLQHRNKCIDKRCLRRAYEDRMTEVNAVRAALTQEPTSAASIPLRAPEGSRGESPKSEPTVRAELPKSEPAKVVQTPTPSAPNTAVRAAPDELKPYRPSVPITEIAPRACAFHNLQLPADFNIFATGAYTGRVLSFQIDQSGHSATQIDVAVNSPDKPVVLMLGAYEPTIWNIGWTQKTRIVAVLVSGYHRQAIAGLDPKVPTLNSSYDNRGPCGYFYLSGNGGLEQLNPLARKLFGKPADLVYPAGKGAAMVGERVANLNDMVTHPATPPESFRNRSEPLAGPAGLDDAVRTGALRRATQADAQAWADAVAANSPHRDVPPVAGVGVPKPRPPSIHNGYVVLKEFTYPAGLYGGHSATFLIPKGAPRPMGNPGHSTIYDFNRMNCQGVVCNAGR